MEKRLSDRVQFFQFHHDHDLRPIWVFRHAQPESVLGLLLDVSEEGVQILTDKSPSLQGDSFYLIIHSDACQVANFCAAQVRHLWSKAEGTLYVRNGFAFDGVGDLASFIARLLVARADGHKLLRCELVALKAMLSAERSDQPASLAIH